MSASTLAVVAAASIFVITYAFIATERLHRTVAALAGGTLVLLLGLVSQSTALSSASGVDWNVLFLLLGMMIIVTVTRRTGIFQWLAIKAVKLAQGRPARVMVLLSTLTAMLSALLDNVTSVLFMAPISVFIAEAMGISLIPLLISQIIASNIGGTATLIGDPPNIMIGSAARLGFLSFLTNMAPIAILVFGVTMGALVWAFRGQLKGAADASQRVLALNESRAIRDLPLLKRCLIVLAVTFLGFLIHEPLHLRPATIAMAGAVLMLLLTEVDLGEILKEVEWSTLLFFVGLFVLVSALVETGIIHGLAAVLLERAEHSSSGGTAIALLWVAAIGSSLIDNIPFVAAVNPMLQNVAADLAGPGVTGVAALHTPAMMALWWSLALGACLGGNATLIGASANVVIADIAARDGHPIGFSHYLRYGVPLTLLSMVMSTVYVWLRYL
jgi:Na+/H+ antiporter NhaD/arsenite permease-like protein